MIKHTTIPQAAIEAAQRMIETVWGGSHTMAEIAELALRAAAPHLAADDLLRREAAAVARRAEKRIGELLDANNREVEGRRETELRLRRALDEAALARADTLELLNALRALHAAFLLRNSGCYPTDRVTPEQRQWGAAMDLASELLRKYEAVGK